MKKLATLTSILLILLMLPIMALATTQKEWDQECRAKISNTATLYAIERDPNAADTSLSPKLQEIGSLPGGTYVKTGKYDYDLRMWQIAYFKDGNLCEAWVEKKAVADASTDIYFDDGSYTTVPEAVAKDTDALLGLLKKKHPDKSYSPIEGSSIIHVDASSPGATPQPAKDPKTDTAGKIVGEWKPGQLISQEELAFNAECPWRLSRTIKGYSDAHMTKKYETINIGTYCMIATSFDDVVKIAYYKNGERHMAHIERADLLGASTQYKNAQGQIESISQADPNYGAVVASHEVTWLAQSIQEDLDAQVEAERAAAGKDEKGSAAMKDKGASGVTVKELGTHTSRVSYQGKTIQVPTAELSFEADVPKDKRLAVIYTPKTGKAGLRASASGNADILKQCKAGTLVSVLEVAKTYTKINYKNTVGYIQTDCLKFIDVSAETADKGILSYKGKTGGGTTVNIRLAADGGSRKIGEMKTGTEVTVFTFVDGWYGVEAQGIRGYVMEEYLLVKE